MPIASKHKLTSAQFTERARQLKLLGDQLNWLEKSVGRMMASLDVLRAAELLGHESCHCKGRLRIAARGN